MKAPGTAHAKDVRTIVKKKRVIVLGALVAPLLLLILYFADIFLLRSHCHETFNGLSAVERMTMNATPDPVDLQPIPKGFCRAIPVPLGSQAVTLLSSDYEKVPWQAPKFRSEELTVIFGKSYSLADSEYRGLLDDAGVPAGPGHDVYGFIRAVYHATLDDLDHSWSPWALRKRRGLLATKTVILPKGVDNSFKEFTCGDLKGFIAGDIGKDQLVLIEVFNLNTNAFVVLYVKNNARATMQDVLDLVSRITVGP